MTAPKNVGKVTIFGAGYRIPFHALGDSLELWAGYSDVNSGVVQNLFNVSGKGSILGARWTHNLPGHGAYEHKLAFGIDQRVYRNSVTAGGVSLVPDIAVHPVNLAYSGKWRGERDAAGFSVGAVANLKGGSRGGEADAVDADFRRVWATADVDIGALTAR